MKLGSTVTLVYRGTLEDGTLFGKADADEPMVFQTGMGTWSSMASRTRFSRWRRARRRRSLSACTMPMASTSTTSWSVFPLENIPFGDIEVGKRVWMINDAGEKVAVTVAAVEPDAVSRHEPYSRP